MSRLAYLLVTATSLAATGCPSSSHRIPHDELMALSQRPPEVRGERVRVIQSLGSQDEPPDPAPRVSGGVHVYVAAPIWIGGRPYHHRHHPQTSGPKHAGGGGGGSNLAGAKKDEAKVWLVIAAVAAGALALTEGIRYDGWVKLHPMQPVHMWGPYGDYTWMPLAHVTPEVAAWAERAAVRSDEGPMEHLGRAPLNRRGLTYSVLLGATEVALIGDDPKPGFLGHIQFGVFPTHMIGIQADIAYGWADDDLGATVFDGRYSLELDVLPLDAGVLHGGGYAQLGFASRSDDGIQFDDSSALFGGGGILQLELTTRLALTLRAGLVAAHDEALGELTGGISIY